MTATESVSTDSMVIGAKNVSGLFRRGWVTTVIMVTTNTIYAEALIAFIKGFLVIGLLYHVVLLFGTNCRYCCFYPSTTACSSIILLLYGSLQDQVFSSARRPLLLPLFFVDRASFHPKFLGRFAM